MDRILIVFYSRPRSEGIDGKKGMSEPGNTEAVALKLQQLTGADIFRIDTAKPYPDNMDRLGEVAKAEKESEARPALKQAIPDMHGYDTVILGYPIWHGTMPMVVKTFLEKVDFSGKTVIPFATHEISGMGDSEQALKVCCSSADVLPGTALLVTALSDAGEQIAGIASVAKDTEAHR